MTQLEHTLRPPDADGPPLAMRVSVQNRTLRFVLTFDNQPKGLWRADLPQALSEELAILEAKLKSPVNVAVIPPDLPMPSAIIATVVTEQPQAALVEWNQAVLRALRNLSMAHGIEMPSNLITSSLETASADANTTTET
ncbi:MAG: hypothetical protein RI897_1256 [Verrucomicrobiota bacterium]